MHIDMAPRTASRARRGSGRRVTGEVLGVQCTPHAFAMFLSHMQAHSQKNRQRRFSTKTIVMRMDLMSQRWRSLPAHEKEEFVAKSLAALQNKRGKARQAPAGTSAGHACAGCSIRGGGAATPCATAADGDCSGWSFAAVFVAAGAGNITDVGYWACRLCGLGRPCCSCSRGASHLGLD